MNKILNIYKTLFKQYGPQGWWPLVSIKGINPTKTGVIKGYHPNNYTYPLNKNQQFEICIGAILTQNTSWPNVEKAILNLKKEKLISAKKILEVDQDLLKELIRPAGYFNQKSIYLKEFTKFFLELTGKIPSRDDLLKVKGIGPETADSILLYAFKQPEFVIDAYTKRIFTNLNIINENAKYSEIKKLFENNLPQDLIIYQEFHALIVEHAKHYYLKKPYDDPFLRN